MSLLQVKWRENQKHTLIHIILYTKREGNKLGVLTSEQPVPGSAREDTPGTFWLGGHNANLRVT